MRCTPCERYYERHGIKNPSCHCYEVSSNDVPTFLKVMGLVIILVLMTISYLQMKEGQDKTNNSTVVKVVK